MDSPTLQDVLQMLRAYCATLGFSPFNLHVNGEVDGRAAVIDHPIPKTSPQQGQTSHTEDFASVNWFGTPYTFTTAQRPIVERLWATWEAEMPGITGETLTADHDGESRRLRDIFRDSPAWGTMIQAIRRGVYALVEPRR